MPHFGPIELIIILVIILAIFGAGRLGNVGGSLARGIRDFKKELAEEKPKDEEADAKG
jgi:sec-independent protein translocase protein TatA